MDTQIVDVHAGQLSDVVTGRTATGPIAWWAERPQRWRDHFEWATLDLSGPYRKVPARRRARLGSWRKQMA